MLIATGLVYFALLVFLIVMQRKIGAMLGDKLDKLTAQSDYELRSTLAADGVAYAEQQALAMYKAHNIKWKPSDKLRAALDYVRLHTAKAGLTWSPEFEYLARLRIEANVAYLSGRVKPVAITMRAPVEVVERTDIGAVSGPGAGLPEALLVEDDEADPSDLPLVSKGTQR